MRVEARDKTIGELFSEGHYTIPDFQRGYVWTERQVVQLLDDLYEALIDEHGDLFPNSHYFVGSVVTYKDSTDESGLRTHQVIDGQQRLTTIFLMLCIAQHFIPDNTLFKKQLKHHIEGNQTYRITPQHSVFLQIFENIIENKPDSELVNIDTRSANMTDTLFKMLRARTAIELFYRNKFQKDEQKLEGFLHHLLGKVQFVHIISPGVSDSFKTFETINDRGTRLTTLDLLKNLLYRETEKTIERETENKKEAVRRALNAEWQRFIDTLHPPSTKTIDPKKGDIFLRYYILSQHGGTKDGRIIKQGLVYQWFLDNGKKLHLGEVSFSSLEDETAFEFLDKLTECAKVYNYFLDAKDAQGKHNPYLANLQVLNGKGATSQRPYILLLAAKDWELPAFNKLVDRLESLLFCYVATKTDMRILEILFFQWTKIVRNTSTMGEVNGFVEQDMDRAIARFKNIFVKYCEGMTEEELSSRHKNYILAKAYQYQEIQQNNGKAPEDYTSDLSNFVPKKNILFIDHIASQKAIPASHFRKLGNLAIIESDLAQNLDSVKPQEKKEVYATSQFYGTRQLASGKTLDTWNSDAIDTRQKNFADLALKVWGIGESAAT